MREPTARKPFVIQGVTFQSFKVGMNSYAIYTEGERGIVWRRWNRSTYAAKLDGSILGLRFLSEETACAAVAKAMRMKSKVSADISKAMKGVGQ